jgi:hypothetical protein
VDIVDKTTIIYGMYPNSKDHKNRVDTGVYASYNLGVFI